MKASVQYNDFRGSAAADISDHTNLEEYLKSKKVDTNRFNPIGASFYHGYSNIFTMSIICIDRHYTTDKPYIVSLSFDQKISETEFFELFKRFHVIVTTRLGSYDNLSIQEEHAIDGNGNISL